MNRFAVAAIAVCAVLVPHRGEAWEAATTSAGLAEQAALSSALHKRLEDQFGFDAGLFSTLAVPPKDAPALFEILHDLLNPTHGYVPDTRGQQSALAWLVAGAVVADTPSKHAANHFFDPRTGKGLSGKTLEAIDGVKHRVASRTIRERVVRSGVPAIDWITDGDNPMNLAGFHSQYLKAVASGTPGERSRHLAGALLAAGAMLHVLQDMASPSHVRNDLAAHLEIIGRDSSDVGSRFERIASLAYAKVGVPKGEVVTRATLRDYFWAEDKNGLADRTARRTFSAFTLPKSVRLKVSADEAQRKNTIVKHLAKSAPGALLSVDMSRLRVIDDQGVCIANISIGARSARFSIDDDCALEQLAVLLPEAVGYGAGFLDSLFAASVTISATGEGKVGVSVGSVTLGEGTVRVFWDDRLGVRTEYDKSTVSGGKQGVRLVKFKAPPDKARRVTLLYEGTSESGEPVYATATSAYPLPATTAAAK